MITATLNGHDHGHLPSCTGPGERALRRPRHSGNACKVQLRPQLNDRFNGRGPKCVLSIARMRHPSALLPMSHAASTGKNSTTRTPSIDRTE
eukprot:10431665-Alexandrium_andersonii.AAC.1